MELGQGDPGCGVDRSRNRLLPLYARLPTVLLLRSYPRLETIRIGFQRFGTESASSSYWHYNVHNNNILGPGGGFKRVRGLYSARCVALFNRNSFNALPLQPNTQVQLQVHVNS